jgi:glycosyltransferase involved in cell wall biosynthesis
MTTMMGESKMEQSPPPFRVLHVIGSLGMGGANKMLVKLLKCSDRRLFSPTVMTITGRSDLDEDVEKLGIRIINLGVSRGRIPGPGHLTNMIKEVRRLQPELIQGWVYHGNLAASFVARFLKPSPPVIWNIRQSLYDIDDEKRLTRWTIRIGAKISARADKIINNSELSRRQHEEFGFSNSRGLVIPNGFDTDEFRPDPDARPSVLRELGLKDGIRLVGMVGRYTEAKDHKNFLAAARLLNDLDDVHFVLAGPQIDKDNLELKESIATAGVSDRIHLLGIRKDIPRLTAAFDVATLSSRWEGFANVIGEAMACAVPCVVTDVGDSANLVGDTGLVVRRNDASDLARGWRELLAQDQGVRRRLGDSARRRIVDSFSINAVTRRYENVYREAIGSFPLPNRLGDH